MSYDEIKKEIQEAPMTYLPALIVVAVQTALEKNVFLRGAASKMVARLEADFEKKEEGKNPLAGRKAS